MLKRHSISEQLLPKHNAIAITGKIKRINSPLTSNSGLKNYSIVLVACFFLLFGNYFYTQPNFVGETTLNKIFPDDHFLLTFLLMTAPRRSESDFLLRTIDSNHPMFDKARSVYANNLKAQNSIEKKEESLKIPPDIILQNCLIGKAKGCEECTQTLVTSKVLLMYHIGYNTYTSPDRVYKKQEFQCGWRHPF
ncbi:12309_t:CDS:2, partial [Cetraspora pellucida]